MDYILNKLHVKHFCMFFPPCCSCGLHYGLQSCMRRIQLLRESMYGFPTDTEKKMIVAQVSRSNLNITKLWVLNHS